MNPYEFDPTEHAGSGYSESLVSAEQSSPPIGGKSFRVPYARFWSGIIAGIMGLLIYQGIEGLKQNGWPAGILLAMWGLMFVIFLILTVRPHCLVVGSHSIQSGGFLRFDTTADNIQALYFDGRGICISFRSLEGVIAKKERLELFRKRNAKSGSHFVLAGITLEQVEEIRSLLAIPAPAPETAIGRIELYYRGLLQRVPIPYATYALLAALGISFALFALCGLSPLAPTRQQLIDAGANFGPLTTNGESWRLFSSLFIHIGFLHLIVNAATLSFLGARAERIYGPVRYLLIYFLAGMCGSFVSIYYQPELVSAGASGCIFGIMGAIFAHLLTCRASLPREVYEAERKSGILFLISNFIVGFTLPGIDLAAHLGGLVFGFVFALIAKPLPKTDSPFHWARPLTAVGVGLIGLIVAFATLPKVPIEIAEFIEALDRFPEKEAQILKESDAIQAKFTQPNLDAKMLADEIDNKLVFPWRKVRQSFGDFQQVPEMYKQMAPDFQAYLLSREKAWENLAQAIRTNDPVLMMGANAESDKANELIRKMAVPKKQ